MSGFLDFKVFPINSVDAFQQSVSGSNNRGLLVVVQDPNFREEQKVFLRKIFAAVKYSLEEDAALLHLTKEIDWSLAEFVNKTEKKVQHIVLFGVTTGVVNLNAPNYLPVKIKDLYILKADNISDIQTNQDLKKKLWSALQVMFL